ncbi:MAG: diacylglycerol/polyprenol kinase family protein [Dethiobacteraceae bacterium]|jgi:phytol kinase
MSEFILGYGILLSYFVICAAGALTLRQLAAVPKEVFRKTLHVILLGSIFVLIYKFTTWWLSALAAIFFMLMVFPILAVAERLPGYAELLIERKKGEIKRSLVVVFTMFAVLICVCWGWLGQKYLVIAAVLAWGLGDAAAALVGKRFGQHYIEGRMVEGRKTLEGTLAMFVVSFVSVLIVLSVNGPLPWYSYLPIALITAAVCALVELYTKGGMDTLTCPFSAAFIMILLLHLWGVLI